MDRRRWLLAMGGGLATTLLMLVLGSAWRPPVADGHPGPGSGVSRPEAATTTAESDDLPRASDEGTAGAFCGTVIRHGQETGTRPETQGQSP